MGMHCAVKEFTCDHSDPDVMETFLAEVFVMKNLQHENLVRFYGACMDPPAIVTELLIGNLASLLYGKDSRPANGGPMAEMTDRRQLLITLGIINGLNVLHKHGVCHRDLKSPNVLYDRDLRIKLCDFAFSRFKKEQCGENMDSRVGTPAWMAPEILRGDRYSISADLYSYGVILWEMVTRSEPFKGVNAFAIAYQVGTEHRRLEIPATCPFLWRRLMQLCWAKPGARPSVPDIMALLQQLKSFIIDGGAICEYLPGGHGGPTWFQRAAEGLTSSSGEAGAASELQLGSTSDPSPEPMAAKMVSSDHMEGAKPTGHELKNGDQKGCELPDKPVCDEVIDIDIDSSI